jgi:RNA polymerase sigma factor (sigma-70 family)
LNDADFERLYTEEAQGLFAFLAYRTGDRSLAEDLLADAFERALKGRFNPRKGSAKTWLYSIALNLLRDHLRRAAAEGRAYQRVDTSPAGDPVADFDARDELLRAMATLSPEEREAIALRFGAALTVPEMAAILGQPLTTVEGRVYRALRKLREALG